MTDDLARLRAFLENPVADREQRRYGAAAETPEACLCTPVGYELDLSHIPQRILDVDYGCGDPTRYAEPGETVLDLGSGSGKSCFMIARAVGPEGRVIGIDKTPEMLALSRGAIDEVTEALGYPEPNVSFRNGWIENLRWDLDRARELAEGRALSDAVVAEIAEALDADPMIPDGSIDLVVSNCVLNLVADDRKPRLFAELARVVKPTGRAIIADIVATEDVPAEMKQDEALWTGCMAGAMRRDRFLDAFKNAGFEAVEEIDVQRWRTHGAIEFLSVTVAAYRTAASRDFAPVANLPVVGEQSCC